MLRYKNERLQNYFDGQLRDAKNFYLLQLKNAREFSEKIEPIVSLLPDDIGWFCSSDKIYIQLPEGGKAEFSKAVTEFESLLGEQPDIRVEAGEFMADFKEHFIHVYLRNPNDCKLIETEEVKTIKVLKPHPECVAALKELEQAG